MCSFWQCWQPLSCSLQSFPLWIVLLLQIAAWLLSINQRQAPKSHLMQRPLDSTQRKGVGRRKPNSDRPVERGQAGFAVAGVSQGDRQQEEQAGSQRGRVQHSSAGSSRSQRMRQDRQTRRQGTDSSPGSSEQPNCPWILSGEKARARGGPWGEIHSSQELQEAGWEQRVGGAP